MLGLLVVRLPGHAFTPGASSTSTYCGPGWAVVDPYVMKAHTARTSDANTASLTLALTCRMLLTPPCEPLLGEPRLEPASMGVLRVLRVLCVLGVCIAAQLLPAYLPSDPGETEVFRVTCGSHSSSSRPVHIMHM